MKKIFICVGLLISACAVCAQEYVGGSGRPFGKEFSRWEVSAGWEGSSGELELAASDRSTSGAHGVFGRALYYPYRYMGLGIEGTYFASQSFGPLVDKYHKSRLGVVAKIHLSPNTNPRVYVLAGAGTTKHTLTYASPFDQSRDHKQIFYGMVGLGFEADIYKNLFIAAEGQFQYNRRTQVAKWFALKDRWDTVFHLGAGVRF